MKLNYSCRTIANGRVFGAGISLARWLVGLAYDPRYCALTLHLGPFWFVVHDARTGR